MHQIIHKFAFVNGINKFYAFQYRKHTQKDDSNIQKGWQIYNIRAEFSRQGAAKFFCFEEGKSLKNAFKLVKNYNFDISSTYPA